MSETAEYRSKRRFCNYLRNNPWEWQYTIFHTSITHGKEAIRYGQALRRLLAAEYTSQPFLWRLCLIIVPTIYFDPEADWDDLVEAKKNSRKNYSSPKIVMPFHTLFTTKKLKYGTLQKNIENKVTPYIRLKNRRVNPGRIEGYCQAVMLQKPHDLKKFFGGKKINRFSLINRASLSG